MAKENTYDGVVFAGTKDGDSYGFYLPDSVVDKDGNVSLRDYVTLTNDEHMALMDAQAEGKVIVFHADKKPTLEDPPPPTDEELAQQIRSKRDALIESVEWRIQRYQQQCALGIKPNDSAESYASLLAYVQALRDVTNQDRFPQDTVFPELPV